MSGPGALVRKQDLPPPGGYRPIPFARQVPKPFMSAPAIVALYVAVSSIAFYRYYGINKNVKKNRIESRSAKLAMLPFLLAESDRDYLKQMRINRDEENRLMANVEGWETGTWYGEQVYKTKDRNEFVEYSFNEEYAHANPSIMEQIIYFFQYF